VAKQPPKAAAKGKASAKVPRSRPAKAEREKSNPRVKDSASGKPRPPAAKRAENLRARAAWFQRRTARASDHDD
jgi:hypothetical protein